MLQFRNVPKIRGQQLIMNNTQRYKIWMFLVSYTALVFINITGSLFPNESAGAKIMDMLSKISLTAYGGVCFVLLLAMNKRQTFRYCRAVKSFMAGTLVWLFWGVYITLGGLALFTSSASYITLTRLWIIVLSTFITVKLASVYDLIQELIGIRVFILATVLLSAYIVHFNGLDFLPSLTHILDKSGRYRVSFGFKHANSTGRLCLEFFMMKALYKCVIREKSENSHKVDKLCTYLKFIQPVVIVMLISCASRTSISAVVLFWLVYFSLRAYVKTPVTLKAMFIVVLAFTCFVLAVIVDWAKLWYIFSVYSSRTANYTSTLPLLSAKSTWLAGLGFKFIERLNTFREVTYLDSFYLWTLLETGLVGFILLIGTIYYFAFNYIRNVRYMTDFHRLTAGLMAVLLYYGLFESRMFGKDSADILNWVLVITAANDMANRKAFAIKANKVSLKRKTL